MLQAIARLASEDMKQVMNSITVSTKTGCKAIPISGSRTALWMKLVMSEMRSSCIAILIVGSHFPGQNDACMWDTTGRSSLLDADLQDLYTLLLQTESEATEAKVEVMISPKTGWLG